MKTIRYKQTKPKKVRAYYIKGADFLYIYVLKNTQSKD